MTAAAKLEPTTVQAPFNFQPTRNKTDNEGTVSKENLPHKPTSAWPIQKPQQASRVKKQESYLKQPVAPSVESGDDGGMDIAAVEALKTERERERKFGIRRAEQATESVASFLLSSSAAFRKKGGAFTKRTTLTTFFKLTPVS